jgi:hypothetical protein
MAFPMTEPVRRLRLKPLQVEGLTQPIDLPEGRLKIGRAAECDLVLPAEAFPSVSQVHCQLRSEGERLIVEDAGSRNGTLVNGTRIEKHELAAGDVIQLGALGPRFLVSSANSLAETMFVDPENLGVGALSKNALKQELGVPDDIGVEDFVRRRSKGNLTKIASMLVLVTVSIVLWNRRLSQRGDVDRAEILALHEQVEDARAKRDADVAEALLQHQANVGELEAQKRRLEEDRRTLQARLIRLETSGHASTEELRNLRGELDGTRDELESARAELHLYNPIDLRKERLTQVSRVRRSIVLIESKTLVLDTRTGKPLYFESIKGTRVPNFENRGERVELESTGSGFCISPEGYILTNAHVIEPVDANPVPGGRIPLPDGREVFVRAGVELAAVFSDTSERHPATVISVAKEDGQDLGLIRIQPFEGMPTIEDFDLSAPLPAPGEDVYLFGFPLGNFALQQGDTVIASTFRGIVSRVVDSKLQVDAGVHPGNSGGPVKDALGRVVGVVFSVQSMPDRSAVYTIGYALPIKDAGALWPPPE